MADESGGEICENCSKYCKDSCYEKCYLCKKPLKKSHDKSNLLNEKRLSVINRNRGFRLKVLANLYHLCQRCCRDLVQLEKNYDFEKCITEKIPEGHKENVSVTRRNTEVRGEGLA